MSDCTNPSLSLSLSLSLSQVSVWTKTLTMLYFPSRTQPREKAYTRSVATQSRLSLDIIRQDLVYVVFPLSILVRQLNFYPRNNLALSSTFTTSSS